MKIIEEYSDGFDVECSCGAQFYARRNWGVVTCHACSRQRDPRNLRRKWVLDNDPSNAGELQAL